jgi:hypothetical protein
MKPERAKFYFKELRLEAEERLEKAKTFGLLKAPSLPHLDIGGWLKQKLFGLYDFDYYDITYKQTISDVEAKRSDEMITRYQNVDTLKEAARKARILGAATTAASHALLWGGIFYPILAGMFNGYENTKGGLAILASYYIGLLMIHHGLDKRGSSLHDDNYFMRLAIDRIEKPKKYEGMVIVNYDLQE